MTQPVNTQCRVVYVTSPIHSGSTLFDYLLGSHSSVVSVGEVAKIAAFANCRHVATVVDQSNKCACGAQTIWDCEFWPKVNQELCELTKDDLSLKRLDLSSDDDAIFASHNALLFDAIARATGATIIVDSTKGPLRARRLVKTLGARVRVIELRRRPHGQVYSVLKRKPLLGIRTATVPYRRFRKQAKIQLKGIATHCVRYEELACAPEEVMDSVMRELGLEFEPGQLLFRNAEHHNIAGNRMRFAKSHHIRPDEQWKRQLTVIQKAAISILTSQFPGSRLL